MGSDTQDGRALSAPGSREPSPAVSAASGFDPSRECFLAQLRRVNTERYEAWVTTDEPIMLCAHCGRDEGSAAASGHNVCLAPFTRQEHSFTRPHGSLTKKVRADAGILFDAAELGGEVGELLNVVKKLVREEAGWRGSRASQGDFADECADVLICLDKLARRRGVDLVAATVSKFNATSEKQGFPHMLCASGMQLREDGLPAEAEGLQPDPKGDAQPQPKDSTNG